MERIPRTIHYCWFGGKEKPPLIRRCIESWKTHLSGYEFQEWNETTFDVRQIPYAAEAYEAKKYAFVSDYARVYALYHHGGIYLDTDVEVFKPFDDLLHHDSFWGFEQAHYIATSTIGARRRNRLIGMFLQTYEGRSFLREDGGFDELTNVAGVTRLLKELGLRADGEYQELAGIGSFYPQTYFSPYDYINCRSLRSEHTYTMHHFYKSWMPLRERWKGGVKRAASKVIGGDNIARLRGLVKK